MIEPLLFTADEQLVVCNGHGHQEQGCQQSRCIAQRAGWSSLLASEPKILMISRCRLQKLPLEACLDCIKVYPVHDAMDALSILEATVLQEQVCHLSIFHARTAGPANVICWNFKHLPFGWSCQATDAHASLGI